jgi:hypothetical protein
MSVSVFFRYFVLFFALTYLQVSAFAQSAKKVMRSGEAKSEITSDGKLTEADWQTVEPAVDFVQNSPVPGAAPSQKTAVRILYDNDAVYVGAMMYDKHPDSILTQLSARDDYGNNNDYFGVLFDTYFDQQNATEFIVTASGVQADGIIKFDGTDFSWNAAWYSKVVVSDSGWCVEMKLPYSALRFPKKAEQKWGVNFFRLIRRKREKSYWNNVTPNISNIIGQSGTLEGIHNVASPLRLALLPYISGYVQNYEGANAQTLNGGMDIKYGINEGFTLDMTLIPDFGQTLFDNKVLNLSPIEVRYDERRYFFTEGLYLFNKNDLFYSRRIGATPVNYTAATGVRAVEKVDKNPISTKLYNATKITGRNKQNLGIGIFNAISEPSYAIIRDTETNTTRQLQTSPLTNYNAIVLDQALVNNSYLSFVNTNVTRKENSYNANVTSILFKFANKTNIFGTSGSTDQSIIYGPSWSNSGYRYYFDIGKISGNYTCLLRTSSISDKFNPNDMGYLAQNNITYYVFDQTYRTFKPFGIINTSYSTVGVNYYRVFNPDVFQQFSVDGNHSVTFKNFLTAGAYWEVKPYKSYDYIEPRTFGRFYLYPSNYMGGAFLSSDYRKKFASDAEINFRSFETTGRRSTYWSVSPRYRFNDKLSVYYRLERLLSRNDVGYVNKIQDSIFLGTRNINTTTQTLTLSYIFTPTMSLSMYGRHYWSQANYSRYDFLDSSGVLRAAPYNKNNNVSFNTFNLYLSLVWQFKPGSEMSIVYQNVIQDIGYILQPNYLNAFDYTLQQPQNNILSVKLIYYIDYAMFKDILHRR